MRPYLAMLGGEPAGEVVEAVRGFMVETGAGSAQIAGSARIYLGVGYRTDNAELALGSALMLKPRVRAGRAAAPVAGHGAGSSRPGGRQRGGRAGRGAARLRPCRLRRPRPTDAHGPACQPGPGALSAFTSPTAFATCTRSAVVAELVDAQR
jgi:hypothetical protein